MASQPPASPPHVSVTAPIHPAIEHTKWVLFRPFDLGKWFAIGFCAWLARLAQGGFSGTPFNFTRSHTPWHQGFSDWNQGFSDAHWQQAKGWMTENFYWILPLAIVLVGVGLTLWVLFTWLGSRGQLMFVHCVALNRAEVAVPWRKYAREAQSLFLFRLALGLIALVPVLALLATLGVIVLGIVRRGDLAPGDVLDLVLAGVALLVLGVVFFVVDKLTRDLVVPILYLRGGTCMAAWKELLGLFTGRIHLLVLYLVFQVVLGVATGVIVFIAFFATICIAFCLVLIPYIGTVVLLPVLVFLRSYSLYYLAQLGPQYQTIQPTPQPPPVAPLANPA